MQFISIVGFGLLAAMILVVVRKDRPEMALPIAIAAAAMILTVLIPQINQVVLVFETLTVKSKLNMSFLKMIVKIVGVAYLAGFGAQICKDAGEGGIAAKIELAGKIFILGMGIPVMTGLLEMILKVF